MVLDIVTVVVEGVPVTVVDDTAVDETLGVVLAVAVVDVVL